MGQLDSERGAAGHAQTADRSAGNECSSGSRKCHTRSEQDSVRAVRAPVARDGLCFRLDLRRGSRIRTESDRHRVRSPSSLHYSHVLLTPPPLRSSGTPPSSLRGSAWRGKTAIVYERLASLSMLPVRLPRTTRLQRSSLLLDHHAAPRPPPPRLSVAQRPVRELPPRRTLHASRPAHALGFKLPEPSNEPLAGTVADGSGPPWLFLLQVLVGLPTALWAYKVRGLFLLDLFDANVELKRWYTPLHNTVPHAGPLPATGHLPPLRPTRNARRTGPSPNRQPRSQGGPTTERRTKSMAPAYGQFARDRGRMEKRKSGRAGRTGASCRDCLPPG